MTDIRDYHAYRHLAGRGLVPAISCSNCRQDLLTRINKDDNVYLQCVYCNTNTYPSTRLERYIEESLAKHS